MRLFKVLCASAVVALVWWLEFSYVLPLGTNNGWCAAFAALFLLLVCSSVTVVAFAYFITGWPTSEYYH